VFGNKVPRRIFGPKRDELTREWSKVHNDELSDLCFLPRFVRVIKSRRMRRAVHVTLMGKRRGVDRVLVGKSEGKRTLGRTRCKFDTNIKMDLLEEELGGIDWIDLAQDRDKWWSLVNGVINLRVPYNVGSFLTSWEPVNFSRRTLIPGVSK